MGASQLSAKCFIVVKFPNAFIHPCLLLLLYLDPLLILLKIHDGDTKYGLEPYLSFCLCVSSCQGSNKLIVLMVTVISINPLS